MHNYIKKLARMGVKDLHLVNAVIQHEDGCGIFSRGRCDCDPDITIIPSTSAEDFASTFLTLSGAKPTN